MFWFWWIYGSGVGIVLSVLAAEAWLKIHTISDLGREEWDLQPENPPRVSVVVPARDEERDIGATLAALCAQDYPELEIITVDDRSSDQTGAIMERAAAECGRIRIVSIAELPPGWLGKTYAMQRGAQAATGEWLIFTDADVIFRADAVRRAVAYAESSGADHLVLLPQFITTSAGERMIKAVAMIIVMLARPWKVSDPGSAVHMGAGAFNMLRRSALQAIGAMDTLRLAVVEDLKIGQLVKRAGLASRLAVGFDLIRIRWIEGTLGIVSNINKNAFAVFGFRWWLALLLVLLGIAFHIVPFVLVWLAPGWSKLGFAAALLALWALYAKVWRLTGISPLYFFLHPLGAGIFIYATLRSALTTARQGGIVWRGTSYSIDELRQAAAQERLWR